MRLSDFLRSETSMVMADWEQFAKVHIYRRVIASALRQSCPRSIPRSGNAGKQVNCYTVELRNGKDPYLLVDGVTEIGVQGLQWSDADHEYKIQAEISFSEIRNFDLAITHFYGMVEVRFEGVFDYFIECVFPWAYFKIWWNGVQQTVYNRQKLFRAKRIKILELLADRHIENGGKSISSWDIMNELHSIRWFEHPQGEFEHDRLQLFLDSLVETGDLEKDRDLPFYFKVKGMALKTLSDFSLEEERHKQNLSLQRKMTYLTWVLAISAILTVLATATTITKDSLLWKKYTEVISKRDQEKYSADH